MGCGCGGASAMSAMTTTEVNAMLEQARVQAQEAAKSELEAMLESARKAVANASSDAATQR